MKLLFVLIVTGFLVFLLVGMMFRVFFGTTAHKTLENNIYNYAEYIIQDIGIPPDTLRARQIGKEFDIDIRYEGYEFIWATSSAVPSINKIKKSKKFHRFHKRRWIHEYIVIENPDGSHFLFHSKLKKYFKIPPRTYIRFSFLFDFNSLRHSLFY